MTAPVEPKPEYAQYGWLSLAALMGSIARAGKWTDANGKFMLSKLITEMAGAVVLGVIVAGLGAYYELKPAVIGGLAGGAGLIGATGVTGIIQSVISIRLGGKKDDASDPQSS